MSGNFQDIGNVNRHYLNCEGSRLIEIVAYLNLWDEYISMLLL